MTEEDRRLDREELLQLVAELRAEIAQLREHGARADALAASNAHAAELMANLEDSLDEQKAMAERLADSNVRAAELMAELEAALDEQKALAGKLAESNALAAELMAELEEAREADRMILVEELDAAVDYVRSLLPPPIRGGVTVDWRFVPSAGLGGDAFGYYWIDDDAFVIYLLDVCGHGLAATLLATTVVSALRAQQLRGVDFRHPHDVLAALNVTFPMSKHGGQYFTAFYAVYRPSLGTLSYATAGHPPGLLVRGKTAFELETPAPMLGVVPESPFVSGEARLEPGDRLFVFSDGVYEIERPDGSMLTFEQFRDELIRRCATEETLDCCVRFALETRGKDSLPDDYSLVCATFGK